MSVVILGGNECMVRKYKDLCRSYQCSAKVISKMGGTLKNRLGNPDLLVMSALGNILETHAGPKS